MIEALTSVTNAIKLASRLREISENIKDAEFKNLLADLSLELADTKLQVADLTNENTALKTQIESLTSATGEQCPKCNNRTFQIISTKPHPVYGIMGAKERKYECSGCGFAESKMVDKP